MTNPIIYNPNIRLVPIETPKPIHRDYRVAPAGTKIISSDGTTYIKQKDGSVRRAVPKVKGKKKKGDKG